MYVGRGQPSPVWNTDLWSDTLSYTTNCWPMPFPNEERNWSPQRKPTCTLTESHTIVWSWAGIEQGRSELTGGSADATTTPFPLGFPVLETDILYTGQYYSCHGSLPKGLGHDKSRDAIFSFRSTSMVNWPNQGIPFVCLIFFKATQDNRMVVIQEKMQFYFSQPSCKDDI